MTHHPPLSSFTDLENSTPFWEQFPEAMRPALEQHDVYNRSKESDAKLNCIMQEVLDKTIELVEINPGKGNG